jgi:hypothetical protein
MKIAIAAVAATTALFASGAPVAADTPAALRALELQIGDQESTVAKALGGGKITSGQSSNLEAALRTLEKDVAKAAQVNGGFLTAGQRQTFEGQLSRDKTDLTQTERRDATGR